MFEKYSKDNFEKRDTKLEDASSRLHANEKKLEKSDNPTHVYAPRKGGFVSVLEAEERSVIEAQEKLNEMLGKGQAEAIELNREYNRLRAKVEEALIAVRDFEREKLGMKVE